MRAKIEIVAVHATKNAEKFIGAYHGDNLLMYSTQPMEPNPNPTREEFTGEYFVPGDKALRLYDLIQAGTPPEEIVEQLELEKMSLDDLCNPDGTVREPYLSAEERQELREQRYAAPVREPRPSMPLLPSHPIPESAKCRLPQFDAREYVHSGRWVPLE